ncbi:glycoside hydrolase family 19 protein [Sulfitobacter pontiacus]
MLKLNRKVFFSKVRHGPFPGKLTVNQVAGMNDLLDVWETHGSDDPRHLAYTFATDFHETGAKMQPVREGFKSTDKESRAYVQRNYGHKGSKWYCWPQGPFGHVYYGRGDVQLTWYDNYVRMGKILGLPLAQNPDMVLESKVSKMIMVEGMLNGSSKDGDFTGLALEDYFNATTDDPTNARRIINGTDKAFLIAGYHDEFLEAIEAALAAKLHDLPDEPIELPATLPKKNDQTSWGGLLAVLGGLGGAASGFSDNVPGSATVAVVAVIAVGAFMLVRGRKNILNSTGE